MKKNEINIKGVQFRNQNDTQNAYTGNSNVNHFEVDVTFELGDESKEQDFVKALDMYATLPMYVSSTTIDRLNTHPGEYSRKGKWDNLKYKSLPYDLVVDQYDDNQSMLKLVLQKAVLDAAIHISEGKQLPDGDDMILAFRNKEDAKFMLKQYAA